MKNKFFNYMPVPKDTPENLTSMFGAIMQIKWLMSLIGIAEVTGGALIMLSKYRALGAIIIFPVMIGILLTSISLSSGILMAIILMVILIWILFENRKKYIPMIN